MIPTNNGYNPTHSSIEVMLFFPTDKNKFYGSLGSLTGFEDEGKICEIFHLKQNDDLEIKSYDSGDWREKKKA